MEKGCCWGEGGFAACCPWEAVIGNADIDRGVIGKLITLNKRAKVSGIALRLCEMSPAVMAVFRGIWPGDGLAGVFAVLKPPPKNDGGRAFPEYDEEEE